MSAESGTMNITNLQLANSLVARHFDMMNGASSQFSTRKSAVGALTDGCPRTCAATHHIGFVALSVELGGAVVAL